MRTIRHPVGYTLPVLRDRLTQLVYDPDTDTTTPTAWDLNDPSVDHVQLVLTPTSGGPPIVNAAMVIDAGALGDIHYPWILADVATVGKHVAVEEVHAAGGGAQVAPAFIVEFYDPQAVGLAAASPLCAPWVALEELPCAAAPGAEMYLQAASELLFYASGGAFTGLCTSTVRPCPGLCGCGYDWCAECATPCNVTRLLEPVVEILEVTIDGQDEDPGNYHLYDHHLLQKLDGAWPVQNLMIPAGNPGTWTVTFTHGVAPPLLGVIAVTDAACYLASVYGGAECKLPAHMQSLARQGINQTFDPQMTAVLALPSVQMFLGDAGYGIGQPQVWTPDMPHDPPEVLS